jgi:hypothetical protein
MTPSDPQNTKANVFGPQVNTGPKIVPTHLVPVEKAPLAAPPPTPALVPVVKDLPEPKQLSEYVGGDLTPEQKESLDTFSKKMRSGLSSAVPMVCRGIGCPFIEICPLQQAKIELPRNKTCPVEESVIQAWKRDFMVYSNIPDDHEQKALIYQLIEELATMVAIQTRVAWANAREPEIFRDEVIGANQQGDPIIAKRLNPSLDLLQRIGTNKLKILRELLATPRAEVEAKRKMGIDPSSQAAATMAKIAKLQGAKQIEAGYMRVELNGPSGSQNS